MMGPTHRLLGAAAGLGVGVALGWPAWQCGGSAALATVTAGGRWSPDCDQYKWWRTLDRLVPDELLGKGGPLGHRRLSHWWGVPVAVAVVVWFFVPAAWQWPAWALLAGWGSHLVPGDLVFGKACPMDGRGPGVPLWPWWGHVGLGLRCGGALEGLVRVAVLPVALAWLGLAAAGHGDVPAAVWAAVSS